MKSKTRLDMTLRNQEVTVSLIIQDPDPGVGLAWPWFEDEEIFDLEGKPLDWELTEKEIQAIGEKVNDHYFDSHDEDYYDPRLQE